MIELVTAQYMWAYDLDENGAPVLAGEPVMRPVESRSVYASVREAMLQAAHNEILQPGMEQRIEQNGNKVAGKREIRAASKRLQGHREDTGFMSKEGRMVIPTYDAKSELSVVDPRG